MDIMQMHAKVDDGEVILGPTDFERFLFVTNNIIIILILVGNSATLALLCINKRLRTIPNTFAVNLAVSDILTGVTYFVYNILNFSTVGYNMVYNDVPCLTCMYFLVVAIGISQLTILAVCADRYLAVVHPLAYIRYSSQRAVNIIIVGIWIYTLVFGSTIFLFYETETEREFYERACSILNQISQWYYFGMLMPHFFITTILARVFIWKVLQVANRHSQQIHNERVRRARILQERIIKRERKADKMRALVLGLFLLCWLPYAFLKLIVQILGPVFPSWIYYMMETAKLLSLSNSFMNPVIYFWKNEDFRQALAACTGCKRLRVENHAVVVPSNRPRRVAVVSAGSQSPSTSSPSNQAR